METDRWKQVDELLQRALDRPAEERSAFLERECAGDVALKREVESLILSSEEGASFIKRSSLDSELDLSLKEHTSLEVGRVMGDYQIVRQLGSGGMGEVYLARHTQHDRPAALKILPSHFTSDKQRNERFRREARAVLRLNHPNVVTAYDIGEHDGVPFIATEFVEGETLGTRLENQGHLELTEALDVATQVAAALVYAHEQGVVHRDIKPENVMLRADGYVKVLDFGIAKLDTRQSVGAFTEEAATKLKGSTAPGMVIGTASYMSPEQARGLAVDERSDVWSLGAVLYESLTGQTPFAGESVTDTLANVIHRNPKPISELIPDIPDEVERIVSKSLEKDREDRYQTARDMLADLRRFRKRHDQQIELERSGTANRERAAASGDAPAQSSATVVDAGAATTAGAKRHSTSAEYIVSQVKSHKRGAVIIMAVAIILVAGLSFGLYKFVIKGTKNNHPPVAALQNMKLTRLPIGSGKNAGAVISPDGKFVARGVVEGGTQGLNLRQVAGTVEKEIVPLTKGVLYGMTFSPDSNSLYYSFKKEGERLNNLYRVAVLGGDPQRIGSQSDLGLSISPDGKRLVFARDDGSQSSIVVLNVDSGAEETILTRAAPSNFDFPQWSPDGKVIVYVVYSVDPQGYFVNLEEVNLADRTPRVLNAGRWRQIPAITWLPDASGLIMCARDRASLPDTPTQLWHIGYPSGEPYKITNDLNTYTGPITITADSRTLLVSQNQFLSQVWVAPGSDSAKARSITPSGAAGDAGLSWAPDGRIVYSSDVSGNHEIWIANADGSGSKQLTFDRFADMYPWVSPDGRYIVFMTNRSVGWSMWRMNADGSGARELVSNIEQKANPQFSPDSRWIFYWSRDTAGKAIVWKISVDGGEPVKILDKEVVTYELSPDGKQLAVIYRDPEPNKPRKFQIYPVDGGAPSQPLETPIGMAGATWAPDGKSLDCFIDQDGASNLWRLPLDGGKPRKLTDWKTELIYMVVWSRDGKQLAASRGNEVIDLLLIENFR